MPTLTLSNADPATLRADAVVVGVHSGPDGPALAAGAGGIDEALEGRLTGALPALQVTGKAGKIASLPTFGATAAAVVITVGLGEPADSSYDPEALRRAAGAGVRAAAGQQRVTVALPVEGRESLRAVCEGAMLGAYAFTRYRTSSLDKAQTPVSAITVVSTERRAKPISRNRLRSWDVGEKKIEEEKAETKKNHPATRASCISSSRYCEPCLKFYGSISDQDQ